MSERVSEALVVGSGCAGSMAAQTLVEAGVETTVVCGGVSPDGAREPRADLSFDELRRSDPHQDEWMLGETLSKAGGDGGLQLTPARQHLLRDVEAWLPLLSSAFRPVESLAVGGLGGGWGLGCCVFSRAELSDAGLDADEMALAYQRIAARIGISGDDDDASDFTRGGLFDAQPPVALDPTGERIARHYARSASRLKARGFHGGRTALALLTRPLGDRRAHVARDLEFYSDEGAAAFRPARVLSELKLRSGFSHEPGWVVTHFTETGELVEAHALHRETRARRVFRARALFLATGPLGSARIALRSSGGGDRSVPLVCAPYSYVPCVQPALLGAHGRTTSFGLSQFSLFHDSEGAHRDVAMASLYSYRALMLFRLAARLPIGLADGWKLLRFLMPALTIAGIHQPEPASAAGRLRLRARADSLTGDVAEVDYPVTASRTAQLKSRLAEFRWALRTLGAWPLQTLELERGASIHYAGTLPFGDGAPLTTARDGRLGGTSRVYVADASPFRALPAKGPTLSLMAFADVVARKWVGHARSR